MKRTARCRSCMISGSPNFGRLPCTTSKTVCPFRLNGAAMPGLMLLWSETQPPLTSQRTPMPFGFAGLKTSIVVATPYLDEAERCQRLAYISKGKLLADGTVDEVISRVGLTTWEVKGPDLAKLADELRKTSGVQQAVAFGNSLHVSSTDAAELERAIRPFRRDAYEWQQIPSGLEDAFISLMEERSPHHGKTS